MATGLSTKLTGQIGEHLVTAELGRRGIIASPFAGNVPDIDVVGYANNKLTHYQVKTIRKGQWQLSVNKWLNIEATEEGQVLHGPQKDTDRSIICIFVKLGKNLGEDQFYIFTLGWLQDFILDHYTPRKPPKNTNSFHMALHIKNVEKWENNWYLVEP